jgi:beta-barrel assembly-enhancing protease
MSRKSLAFLLSLSLLSGSIAAPAHAQFGGLTGLIGKAKTAKKIGDATRSISEPEEIQIGAQLAGVILTPRPLDDDQAVQHYVNRLGRWLAMHSERPNLPWKFGVTDDTDFNAFSMPGGYVLISRGLFDSMRNESELAGVLSHEIAHVTAKHHIKALQKGKSLAVLSEVGGEVASNQVGGGLTGEALRKIIDAGKDIFTKGLDKNDEYEADRMAVVIAARSGYSPYGLVGVLQTLSGAPADDAHSLLLSTHPSPASRIERLDQVMGTQFDKMMFVDDLASFEQLRNPQPAVQTAAETIAPKPASAKPRRKAR